MVESDLGLAIVSTTLIILILIFGVIVTIFISNKKRLQQETKIAQVQADYEKELRTVTNEVQEQVLVNVGRELHDNIGQMLTVMHLQVEHGRLDKPELQNILKPIDDTLQSTIQQLRLLAKSLNNDVLEQEGLLKVMQTEVARLELLGKFTLHWQHDDTEPKLNKDQKLMAFRIYQEILNNAMKHSGAKNIYLFLKGTGGFRLEVRDDGRGFNAEQQLKTAGGSGLKNIMKRASLANLICHIDSCERKGSIFMLQEANT